MAIPAETLLAYPGDAVEADEWLTLNEAAAYLKVSRVAIYRFCDSDQLRYYEIKGHRGRRFRRKDLDSLLSPVKVKRRGRT
jgi:excisionase family DNA binding protein